jgi:hypothetical protein
MIDFRIGREDDNEATGMIEMMYADLHVVVKLCKVLGANAWPAMGDER